MESLITGAVTQTQSFNLHRGAKATMGKTNVKMERCIDDKADKEDRMKKMDRIHSSLDYALNGRLIPRPICLLATLRRSVTRPDWKWLFFQTLLKCVCVSPITWLLLIKLKSPLQSQWRVSSFSFSSFVFIPESHCRSSKNICEISRLQVQHLGIVSTNSCHVIIRAHPVAWISSSM